MPFKSKAQRRACYAKNDPNWDCEEWEESTPDDLPEKVKSEEISFKEALDIVFETPLTAQARSKLSTGQFALPGKRKYPIHDKSHARNALSRVAQHGTADEKAKVRAAVKRKFPDIGQDED